MEGNNYREVKKEFYFYRRNEVISMGILSKISKKQQKKVIRILPFLKEKIEERLIEKYIGKQYRTINQFQKEIEGEFQGSNLEIIYKRGELQKNIGIYKLSYEEYIDLEIWITFGKQNKYIVISDIL